MELGAKSGRCTMPKLRPRHCQPGSACTTAARSSKPGSNKRNLSSPSNAIWSALRLACSCRNNLPCSQLTSSAGRLRGPDPSCARPITILKGRWVNLNPLCASFRTHALAGFATLSETCSCSTPTALLLTRSCVFPDRWLFKWPCPCSNSHRHETSTFQLRNR